MKRRFRRRPPPRRDVDAGPGEGALQFERARTRMAPLLEQARASLDDTCAVGFPIVHTSTRHASLELARDWSWSLLGRQATGPEIAVVQGDGEEEVQPVGGGDAGLDEVEVSFQDFLAAYRARPR